MKKIEFSEQPQLIESEGSVIRINFDVERNVIPASEGADGQQQEAREVFLAHIVRVPAPVNADSVASAILAAGFSQEKADEIAGQVMMEVMQGFGNDSEALRYAKQMVVARINAYDKSDAVNSFKLNGDDMWFPDAKRTQLAKRFDTDEQDGLKVTKVIDNGKTYTLPIETARVMLHALESYARDCFDKTNEHVANAMAMDDIDALLAYDFTTGYPPNLEFGE